MKTILSVLCMLLSMSLLSQNNPISAINISLPPNPDAITANWKGGSSLLTISATARAVNGRPDVRVEDSRILVIIKKAGGKVCGSFTNASAPAANFTTLNKVWSGNNAVSLLGQECTLPPGDYELTVQLFANGPRGLEPISEEKIKAFTIKGNEQQTYQPPQPMLPANGTILKEEEIKKPVTFRWTPVVPRPQDPVTYRLRVWRMAEGQNSISATIIQQPILGNDVGNVTQAIVRLNTTSPNSNSPEIYVWNVQALNRDGKPIGSNNGTSEAFTITVQPVNDAPVGIKLVSPENGETVRSQHPTFSWTLTPGDVNGDGYYKIKIVEIKGDESPEQAFKGNKPFFEKDSCKPLSFQYPSSAPKLVAGKRYAWNVQALNKDGKPIGLNNGTSKPFSFTVPPVAANGGRISLVSPANGETVRVQNPTFAWKLDPTPADYDGDGYYKIKIVEIKGDESPDNAIRTNKPFFEKDSLKEQSFSGVSFNPGNYAWQVQVLSRNGKPIGENGTSQVWKFSMGPVTAVKIDSIKLNCTSTYGIYNYTVYVTNPLTMNVVLNGFWCRKPADVNLTQLYTLNSQTPPLGTQITASAQITVSGQVNLTSHVPNTMVRFTLKTHKINDPVDNATVTDSIKVVNCACNPCKDKQTTFGSDNSNSDNAGHVNVLSTVTHGPNRVVKVSAQIVNFERLGENGCLRCTKDSKEFGNYTGGSLNGNGGTIVKGSYGKQIQWQFNTPTSINSFNYNLNMMFPPLTDVSCCKDSIRICTRWSFTDDKCITCDTLICKVIVREYKAPPPFTSNGSNAGFYAEQIAKMGEPYISWYNQKGTELPNNFEEQVNKMYENIFIENRQAIENKPSKEEFHQSIVGIFNNIQNLKTSATDAVWNAIYSSTLNTQCDNGNFESGALDATQWGGAFGKIPYSSGGTTATNDVFTRGVYTNGFSPSPVSLNAPITTFLNQHSVVSHGNDPIVGSLLKTTNSSSNNFSFRLGNNVVSYGTEVLSKKFVVTGNGIIKFNYALVLNEPGPAVDPSFTKSAFRVAVYDVNGNRITNKVYLDAANSSPVDYIPSDATSPFFQVYPATSTQTRAVYRDWSCAKIDLSDYIGKQVIVALITNDCSWGGHYGYAYIDDWCGDCSGASTGSLNIKPIAEPCIDKSPQICVDYSLPKIGTSTGSGTIKLEFYQNGVLVPASTLTSPNLSGGTTYCFTINPAKLPCNGKGYDIVATGNFTVGSTAITVTSPDPVGSPIAGIVIGQNNDIYCCTTPAEICCQNFIKKVTTITSMVGNTTSGYNTVKFTPTFQVGPKLIKKVRISVVNFETNSKNKECLTCEVNTGRYGTMSAPQNVMGGGKDPIDGMTYPTTSNIVTCVGCPPTWSNKLSSEVTWGSDAGAGYNLMDGVGDQTTTFNVFLPKRSTINCCDDTIRICIKYSFTDVDCKTCDTIICYKIVNRTTISQPVAVSFMKAAKKSIESDEQFNKSVLEKNDEKHATVAFINIDPKYGQKEDSNQNRRPKDQKIDMLIKETYFAYRR